MRLQLLIGLCLPLFACTPTNLPMDLAEAQCVQYVLNGGGGVTVGMSVGTGGWNNGWNDWGGNGVGVGITALTELPPSQGMTQIYNRCVQRRTGLPPATPFNQRPELQG